MEERILRTQWDEVPATTDKTRRFTHTITLSGDENARNWVHIDDIVDDVALWLDERYLGESDAFNNARVLEIPRHGEQANLAIEFLEPEAMHLPSVDHFTTGPVRITRHKILCTELDASRAGLELHVELDAHTTCTVWVRTTIHHGTVRIGDNARRHNVAQGRNRLRWTESVDAPHIWQPNGDTNGLYDISTIVGVVTDVHDDAEPSDVTTVKTGFRSVEKHRRLIAVNDHSFIVGSSTLRIVRSVLPFKNYDDADRDGELLCQQLPDNLDHARQVIDALVHHPSVIAWAHPSNRVPRLRRSSDPFSHMASRTDPTRPFLYLG